MQPHRLAGALVGAFALLVAVLAYGTAHAIVPLPADLVPYAPFLSVALTFIALALEPFQKNLGGDVLIDPAKGPQLVSAPAPNAAPSNVIAFPTPTTTPSFPPKT